MSSVMDDQIIIGAFPSFLKNEVLIVIHRVPLVSRLSCTSCFDVTTCSEVVHIPYRVYFEEPQSAYENALTPLQRLILHAVFTRHHNGYVRQQRLRTLLGSVNEYEWVMPFIFQLLGEYVIEILDDIDQRIREIDHDLIRRFCIQNPAFMKITESRVISYWNEYYRYGFPEKQMYVGVRIFDYIKDLSG